MANTVVERGTYYLKEYLGNGQYQVTIGAAPLHYQDDQGAWQPIDPTWVDSGIPARPTMVSASKMMVSVGDDGLRRLHPTREASKYLEIGAPYIKIGGVWTKVSLGAPTRSNNLMSWTTTNANVYIYHGGHFVKLEIKLNNGWTPANNQVAFPVGISGLSRTGDTIYDGTTAVAVLTKPYVYDASNPSDVRQISYSFTSVTIGGSNQPILLMTLPDMTGMVDPRVDPTLTQQPDETTGLDTWLSANANTWNFGIAVNMQVGGDGAGTDSRGLLKFDISSIPGGSSVSSANLTLTVQSVGNTTARNIDFRRALVQWFEGNKNGAAPDAGTDGSTWAKKNVNGNVSWGASGGLSGTDYSASVTDTQSVATNGSVITWNVLSDISAFVAGTATNFGWFILNQTVSASSQKSFHTSGATTSSNRPKLVVVYTLPTQTIAPSFITNTSAVYTPKLQETINPSFITNTSAVYTPNLQEVLKPGFITNTSAVYAPTMRQVVAPARIDNASAVYSPALNQVLKPGFITNTSSVYAPSLRQVIFPSRINNASTVYMPSFQLGIKPGLIVNVAEVFDPALAQTLKLSLISNAAQVYVPRLAKVDYIAPARIDNVVQVFAPRLALLDYIRPELIENLSSVFAPIFHRGSAPGRLKLLFEPMVLLKLLFEPVVQLRMLFVIGDQAMERKPDIGDQIRARLLIAHPTTGAPVDPDIVTFKMTDPAGTTTTYVYGTDDEVVKAGTGDYYVLVDFNQAETWTIRWETSGGYKGAEEEAIEVKTSVF